MNIEKIIYITLVFGESCKFRGLGPWDKLFSEYFFYILPIFLPHPSPNLPPPLIWGTIVQKVEVAVIDRAKYLVMCA